MASKRIRYSESSVSGSESDNDYYAYNKFNTLKRKQREPKSFSRNALMARENRLKKKLYMENLERELSKERQQNKKYTNILKQQGEIMEKQEREIKYMRGILANNSDISKLLRTIHQSTGMSVGTSLNKNYTIQSNKMEDASNISNQTPTNIIVKEIHPWSDAQLSNGGLSSSDSVKDPIFDNFDLPPLDIPFDDVLDVPPISPSLDDHNYTIGSSETDESLGVCLHISNHKVSLEYCAQCHENASRLWSEDEPC